MKFKRDREEPCYVCGHYHDFEHGETCSTCGHVLSTVERKTFETVLPANIIPGFLYLGSYDTASRSEMLKAMGISHILNVSCVGSGMHHSHKWRSPIVQLIRHAKSASSRTSSCFTVSMHLACRLCRTAQNCTGTRSHTIHPLPALQTFRSASIS